MPNDVTMFATPVGACSTKGNLPTFDRQQTSASASTSAALVKQRGAYLGKAPTFRGDSHTLYGPTSGLVTPWDTFIDTVSWTAPGGQDEAVELQNAAGQTLFRATAQAMTGPNFSCILVKRFAVGGYRVPVLDSGRLDIQLGRPLRNAVR